MDIKILKNLFLTIERGNPLKRQDQTIHRIMVHHGLLKSGKVEMESTIDQGNLIKILGIHRVALDRLFDRINLDQDVQIKYVETTNQLEKMFRA